MPHKPQKSREERLAESFFPVNPEDLKYAISKPYKPLDISSLIKIEKKGENIEQRTERKTYRKKNAYRKTSKTTRKTTKENKSNKLKFKEFKIPKIKLKPGGYELIITEKPQAAWKIASALGKSTKKAINSVPYYEVERKGEKIIVGCAVGHLFTLAQKNSGSEIPVFDLVWVPNFYVRKNDFSKKYYNALSKLMKNAGVLTVATDYDVEGEVIGLNVVRFIAAQPDAGRMKFSSLTEKELNKAYETKKTSINWGQAIAGETRHFLDWFYGINLSRALMNSLRSIGKFKVMSIGRVQGPILNIIVKKEKEIQAFRKKPYWQVFITLESPKIELIYNKDIFKKEELKKFENLIGKTGRAETKKFQQIIPPNPPFNLTALQIESYRLFGINPGKTLATAQNLYLAGLISYPRTSSQKIPPSVNYKETLQKLAKKYKVENLITREKPVEGHKSDSAHPAIYPTGEDEGTNIEALSGDEKKIYDLIARRFLSLFMSNAVVENKKIKAEIEGLIFMKKGSSIKEKSWMQIYPIKIKEKEIPDLNGTIKVSELRTEEKETHPPKRYTPASLVSLLEKKNLGTKATRATILETLYQRGYIQGQSIKATPLGISLINTLEKHSPIIIDESLTKEFEQEMGSISASKKGHTEKKDKIIEKAKKTIRQIIKQFAKKQKKIGEEISQANQTLIKQQREESKLKTLCPVCKKGNLRISYSKKTRRYFVSCDAYPDCKNTYSLPPNGLVKKSEEICEYCGFQKLMLIKKGRRPWVFCFNPECPTNKKRIEAYRKKREEENQQN